VGTYVVTADDVTAGTIFNTATAASDQTEDATDDNTVTVSTPSIAIVKSNVNDDADGSGDISVGDTITYTYSVENNGTANLTGVTVEDDLLGAATLSDVAGDGVDFLAAGDIETAMLTYTILPTDIGTSIVNVATADSDQSDPDTDTNTIVIPARVIGHLYLDTNGNGTQDAGEPDLAGVDVIITDSNGIIQTVTTDANGDWTATVPPGETTVDVDETDSEYPTGYTQTEGDDPTIVIVIIGAVTDGGTDGYYLIETLEIDAVDVDYSEWGIRRYGIQCVG
jgi:hypothetical protein